MTNNKTSQGTRSNNRLFGATRTPGQPKMKERKDNVRRRIGVILAVGVADVDSSVPHRGVRLPGHRRSSSGVARRRRRAAATVAAADYCH